MQPLTKEQQQRLAELEAQYGIEPFTPPQPPRPSPIVGTAPLNVPTMPSVMDLMGNYLKQQIPMLGEVGDLTGAAVGAQRGAALAPYLPNPVAKGLAVAGGTVLGAIGGRGIGEVGEDLLLGQSTDPVETLYEMYESGSMALLGESVGNAFGMAYRGIKNLRIGKEISQEELKAIEDLQTALKRREAEIKAADPNSTVDLTLTKAQIMQSGLSKSLEKIAVAGFGGGSIQELYEAQADFLVRELERAVPTFGAVSREQLGVAFQTTLRDAESNLITWAKPKYAELDSLGSDVPVDLSGTLGRIKNEIKLGQLGRTKGSGTRLDDEVQTLYNFVLGEKKNNTFSAQFKLLSRLSSDLRKLQGRATAPNEVYEAALVKTIADIHDDLAASAAKSGNLDLIEKYNTVSKVYKTSMSSLRDSALNGLATKAPEFVGETIFQEGNVTTIKKAFAAIDGAVSLAVRAGKTGADLPDGELLKNQIRGGYLDALITPVQTADNSVTTAKKLLLDLTKKGKKADTFKSLFSVKQQEDLVKTLKWGERMEAPQAGNFSLIVRGRQSGSLNKVATQLFQGGAFAGTSIASGATLSPFGAVVALGMLTSPYIIARLATNGKMNQKLISKLTALKTKFDTGNFGRGEWGTLFTLFGDNLSEDTKLPAGVAIKGLDAKQTLRLHALEMEANSPGAFMLNSGP